MNLMKPGSQWKTVISGARLRSTDAEEGKCYFGKVEIFLIVEINFSDAEAGINGPAIVSSVDRKLSTNYSVK